MERPVLITVGLVVVLKVALAWEADFIVRRNTSDCRPSPVPALSLAAFLRRTNRASAKPGER